MTATKHRAEESLSSKCLPGRLPGRGSFVCPTQHAQCAATLTSPGTQTWTGQKAASADKWSCCRCHKDLCTCASGKGHVITDYPGVHFVLIYSAAETTFVKFYAGCCRAILAPQPP